MWGGGRHINLGSGAVWCEVSEFVGMSGRDLTVSLPGLTRKLCGRQKGVHKIGTDLPF